MTTPTIPHWKFNKQCDVPQEWADEYARKIATGEHVPVNGCHCRN